MTSTHESPEASFPSKQSTPARRPSIKSISSCLANSATPASLLQDSASCGTQLICNCVYLNPQWRSNCVGCCGILVNSDNAVLSQADDEIQVWGPYMYCGLDAASFEPSCIWKKTRSRSTHEQCYFCTFALGLTELIQQITPLLSRPYNQNSHINWSLWTTRHFSQVVAFVKFKSYSRTRRVTIRYMNHFFLAPNKWNSIS